MEVELNISKKVIKRILKYLASNTKRLVVTTVCDVIEAFDKTVG